MGRIIGNLNLNKTPQSVDNYSLVFAKNIKLLKDFTIAKDDGLDSMSIDIDAIKESLQITINALENVVYQTDGSKSSRRKIPVAPEYETVLEANNYYSNEKQLEDYQTILQNYEDLDENCEAIIVGIIPYNDEFYICVNTEIEDEGTEEINYLSNILRYSEITKKLTVVNCNWTYSGGNISGYVVKVLNNEIVINIAESSDEILIPFKSINIYKSSITDNESIYTQTPEIPLWNLELVGYHTTPIPNGVYQFFIRYKIWDNHYTNWYPASIPLFAGDRKEVGTNQGQVIRVDTTYDASRSFILNVNKIVNPNPNYTKFQIGFLISHNDENYARSWKEFDIGDSLIYFDYDKNYIKEEDIDLFLESAFQLYNVENITYFKNKLYLSNYIETNFNPDLKNYANDVNVHIDSKTITLPQDDTWNGKVVEFDLSGNIIRINGKTIREILYSAVAGISNAIKNNNEKNSIEIEDCNIKVKYTIGDYQPIHTNSLSDGDNLLKTKTYRIRYSPSITPLPENNDPILYLKNHESTNKFVYVAYPTGFLKGTIEYNNDYYNYEYYFSYNRLGPDPSETDKVLESYNAIDGSYDSGVIMRPNVFTSVYDLIDYMFDNNIWNDYLDSKNEAANDFSTIEFYYVDTYKEESLTSITRETAKFTRCTLFIDVANLDIKYAVDANIDSLNYDNSKNNITTLLPLQSYKFYIHYITKKGEITNGYILSDVDKKTEFTVPYFNDVNNIIYPVFENIDYPDDYIGCFISIQHSKTKIATLFNLETNVIASGIADCLDLDTRLISSVSDIPVVFEDITDPDNPTTIEKVGDYYPSFDSTYYDLFGSSGKLRLRDNSNINAVGYIKLPYTNDSDITTLIKCTPYITKDYNGGTFSADENCNLLGYICGIKKVNTNINKFYSDADKYTKNTIGGTAMQLTIDNSKYDWSKIISSTLNYVYSNYNLNFLSLAIEPTKKIKMIEDAEFEETTSTYYGKSHIVCFNSMELSDVYELRSMYRDYTQKLYFKYSDDDLLNYNNTIRSSILEGDESIINIFKFRAVDYYNIPTNRGIITNLFAIGDSILVHTEDSMFKFTGANTLSTTGGEDVALQESQPFDTGIGELFGSQYGYGGLRIKTESLITNAGYFFYDRDSNILYVYSGQGGLDPISESIQKLLFYDKIVKVNFANDFYNDRIFINIHFNNNQTATITYNIKTKSFVSLHDFSYQNSFSTKTKCYFIKDNKIYYFGNNINYNDLQIDDTLFPYFDFIQKDLNNNDIKIKAAIVDVIYNEIYQQTKALESINWICKEVIKYQNGNIENWNPNFPLMAEETNRAYIGEKLRIYTDLTSTDLININKRSNDWALYRNEENKEVDEAFRDEYSQREGLNSYKYPRFNKGGYSFNYFRNIADFNSQGHMIIKYENAADNNIDGKYDPYKGNGINPFNGVNPYDDQSLIYGKYIVGRFILDPRVNFKLENVTFITTEYK